MLGGGGQDKYTSSRGALPKKSQNITAVKHHTYTYTHRQKLHTPTHHIYSVLHVWGKHVWGKDTFFFDSPLCCSLKSNNSDMVKGHIPHFKVTCIHFGFSRNYNAFHCPPHIRAPHIRVLWHDWLPQAHSSTLMM